MDNKDTLHSLAAQNAANEPIELQTTCQIIGFGPACTSLLVAADRLGLLNTLLDTGLIIHEKASGLQPLLKAGINYDIPSNSDALDFLSGISEDGIFASVLSLPAAQLIRAAQGNAVSLQLVALLIEDIRQCYLQLLSNYPNSYILYNSHVESINQHSDGWNICTTDSTGPVKDHNGNSHLPNKTHIFSAYVIIASGSKPYIPEEIRTLCERHNTSLIHSETMLRDPNILLDSADPTKPIAIIGASHSGFSVLHRLLNQQKGITQKIKMLHHSPIRRMHLSIEAALEAGEKFDVTQDVCPDSGRVFRFQGLYKRSKRLYEDIVQQHYPFVSLYQCSSQVETEQRLEGVSVVVAATGYRPLLPKIRNTSQQQITLARQGSALSLNPQANLCTDIGTPLQGLMAVGLGYGRQHSGIGEPSYSGAPVGINIFQGVDSEAICQQLSAIKPLFCEKRDEEEFV